MRTYCNRAQKKVMIDQGIPWGYLLLSLLKPGFGFLCSRYIFSESTIHCGTLPNAVGKGRKNQCCSFWKLVFFMWCYINTFLKSLHLSNTGKPALPGKKSFKTPGQTSISPPEDLCLAWANCSAHFKDKVSEVLVFSQIVVYWEIWRTLFIIRNKLWLWS